MFIYILGRVNIRSNGLSNHVQFGKLAQENLPGRCHIISAHGGKEAQLFQMWKKETLKAKVLPHHKRKDKSIGRKT